MVISVHQRIGKGGEINQMDLLKKNNSGTRYIENSGVIKKKECTGCSEIKFLSEFGKSKTQFAEVQNKCKRCRNEYYAKNKKRIRLKEREKTVKENADKKQRFENLLKKSFGDIKTFNSYLKEKSIRKRNEIRKTNKHEINRKNRAWYWKHRDSQLLRRGEYVSRNKEKVLAYAKNHYIENRLSKLVETHNRRAHRYSLVGNLTEEELMNVFNHFGNKCALSGSDDFGIDHAIPLNSKILGNEYGNVIPLNPKLNSMKGSKNIFEWFEKVKDTLGLKQSKFDLAIYFLAKSNNMTVIEYKRLTEGLIEVQKV